MGDWVVVILLACITVDGETKNQEVGFATNQKHELVIVSPPWLDVKLKRKEKHDEYYLMEDEKGNPYYIQSIFLNGKFILFIHELKKRHAPSKKERLHLIPPGYRAVNSYVIASIQPTAFPIMD